MSDRVPGLDILHDVWHDVPRVGTRLHGLADGARGAGRRERMMVVVELLATVLTLAGIGLALTHGAEADDILRASVVCIAVLAVAVTRLLQRRRERDADLATTDFVRAALSRCVATYHSMMFVGLMVPLAGLFLVPWWIDGYRQHGQLLGAVALVTAWVPLAALAMISLWVVRSLRLLRKEQSLLLQLQQETADE